MNFFILIENLFYSFLKKKKKIYAIVKDLVIISIKA